MALNVLLKVFIQQVILIDDRSKCSFCLFSPTFCLGKFLTREKWQHHRISCSWIQVPFAHLLSVRPHTRSALFFWRVWKGLQTAWRSLLPVLVLGRRILVTTVLFSPVREQTVILCCRDLFPIHISSVISKALSSLF